jgi:hypothetical protein
MSVNFYIANPKRIAFVELDKGSWSWIIEFLEDFANPNTPIEDLDYLLKNSRNLSWKADDQETISWWRDRIRGFLLNVDRNDIYLVMDDTWQKPDLTHGLVDEMIPPFYRREYTEIDPI